MNPTDRHIGSRTRMRRKMLAMSQTQLADALGITYQQVQKNESGANRVAASRLQQISHILQVPVAFFFEGAPKASAPHGSHGSALIAQIDDFVASSDGLRLIGAFMRIDNADLRRRIVMLVHCRSRWRLRVRFGKLLFGRHRDRTLDEISSLEGTVSKRKDSPYRSGRSPDWLKMKNANAPAVKREEEEEWARRNGGDGQEPDHDLRGEE
jgi:transcriptional regulator with XRE-family HTH domain